MDGGAMKASEAATTTLRYQSGFGNGFETEALAGALPVGRNSPQRCAYGLYAEQLSGSPFTAPRARNERSWLYRIRPTIAHWGAFAPLSLQLWETAPITAPPVAPTPQRWDPLSLPVAPTAFPDGVVTITATGDCAAQTGIATHIGCLTAPMGDAVFSNADAEMLFVPELGGLFFFTEFGRIAADPGQIVVIPRGVKFRLDPASRAARFYLCENYGGAFTLPERGPIGANCLANPRDFLTPVAAYEDRDVATRLMVKWGGGFWQAECAHSPLDVVAWHGNYAPYLYDLDRFSPVGPVRFDHADPSIFTVLTAPSETPGTANVDFVIFPERWSVAEDTFRPPWYHRNIMSEFMGLIRGTYDAKPEGFVPGGFSLHNCMLPHGPDHEAFEQASRATLAPARMRDTLAFMFESRLPQRITRFAAAAPERQSSYPGYGAKLVRHFDPTRP